MSERVVGGREAPFTHHDGSLSSVGDVEVPELLEGIAERVRAGQPESPNPLSSLVDLRAGNVRVENEERSIVLAEDLLGEREGTSCREMARQPCASC